MPEQGGHGAGGLLAGPGHGVAAGHDQLDPVLEGQGAAGHQRGVLAQAVAGAGGGGEAEALHRIEDDQAEHGGGQLGVLGPGQLLNRRLEQEVGQVAPGGLRCLPDELPRGVVDPWLAHSGPLRTLSWEGENQHCYDVSVRRTGSEPPVLHARTGSYRIWGCIFLPVVRPDRPAEHRFLPPPNLAGATFPVRPAAYQGAPAAVATGPSPSRPRRHPRFEALAAPRRPSRPPALADLRRCGHLDSHKRETTEVQPTRRLPAIRMQYRNDRFRFLPVHSGRQPAKAERRRRQRQDSNDGRARSQWQVTRQSSPNGRITN